MNYISIENIKLNGSQLAKLKGGFSGKNDQIHSCHKVYNDEGVGLSLFKYCKKNGQFYEYVKFGGNFVKY